MKRYLLFLSTFFIVFLLTGCANETFEPITLQAEEEAFSLVVSATEEDETIVVTTTLNNKTGEPFDMHYGEDVILLIVDGEPLEEAYRGIGYKKNAHATHTFPSLTVEKSKWNEADEIVASIIFTINDQDIHKTFQLK